MNIVKLLDRNGVQVSPQTHIDSVMNSEGKVLDELYAPLTHVGSYGADQHTVVDASEAGFMSPEMLDHLNHSPVDAYTQIDSDDTEMPAVAHDTMKFESGRHITLVPTTTTPKSIRFDHDTVTVSSSTRTVQSEPEQAFTIEEDYTTDEMGHVTARNRLTVAMPITSRVNNLSSDGGVIYLNGSNGNTGNQTIKASLDLSYDPSTKILKSPLIDSNLVGGEEGSIPYQSDANTSTFLSIGTEGQVLKVLENKPSWQGDKGIKSLAWTNGTTVGPTGTFTRMDDTTVSIPAIPSASATTSGIVTTADQSFSGVKTFEDGIVSHVSDLTGGATGSIPFQNDVNDTVFLPIGAEGYIIKSVGGVPVWSADKGVTSYAWNNGTTAGPTVTTTLVDGSKVTSPAIPSATSSQSGVVTTGDQTYSGNKTFNNNVTVAGDLTVQGNMYAVQEHDLIVSDKRITVASTDNPSAETGTGSGLEVTTYADPNSDDPAQKYHGPSWLWDSESGWSTENTDPTLRSMDINLGSASSVYRINGVQVLSSTQYVGNSATADKVNHKITYFDGKTFDGSADIFVNYDTVGAAVKNHATTTTEFGVASTTNYGHVKVGNGLVVNTGLISVNYGTSATALASAQSAGSAVTVSRSDHVHPFPSLNNCTDTLLVSKGGTGVTTFTTNGVLYGNGTGALRTSNVGTNNQALLSNNGVPTFTTLIMSHISDSGDVPRIADTGLTCSDFT